jgi:periplasmic protein TonB
MRETCARVLAAALLTAAIATVVGMSTLLGTPSQAGPRIAAPPPALERSVRLTALPKPKQPPRPARLVTTDTTYVRPRPEVVRRSLVLVRRHPVRRPAPGRQLAAAKPEPAPTTPPDPPAPAQPAPAAPAQADDQRDDDGGDRGKEHGRGHGHGRGHADQDE